MRIIECDRCHRRIVGVASVGYVNIDMRDVRTGRLEGNHDLDSWDFCAECMDEISKFVRMIPKPSATIKKPIADGTKYSAMTPEKIEQIKRMAKDGKTVKEICEAVGASDPTVRKYMKETENDS